jgi:hypothetical protein
MTTAASFEITWKPREIALAPMAVAARGEASRRLARRLLQFDSESLERLRGVAGKDLILIEARESLLPWVEGAEYLGSDPQAPGLLLPTTYEPDWPLALVARALQSRLGPTGISAVLIHPLLLVPLREARPVDRATLSAWLERP